MKKMIKKILATGFIIAAMATTPAMAYTNDAAPFEFVTGNNIKMHVGDNADLILAGLGEPITSGKVGKDDKAWYYRYNNFVLYTSKPEKGKETITMIEITESGENTKEGLGIGMTETEMLKRYGSKGTSSYNKGTDLTTYTYTKGDSFLDVLINCYNKITLIFYK